MPNKTSLNEKLSDLVGSANYNLNDNIELNYNFALDHNYKDFNYNEFGAKITLNEIKFNFDYLEEKNILEIKNILGQN